VKWEIQLCACGQIISVCNSARIIKIGQYLPKLCSNEKGSSFFDSQCNEEIVLQRQTAHADAVAGRLGRTAEPVWSNRLQTFLTVLNFHPFQGNR